MSNNPLVWLAIILIVFSPLWVYVLAKMITFGILKARKQFNQESEESDGSKSS